MKNPYEIVQSLQEDQKQLDERKSKVGLIKGIITDSKDFFTKLNDKLIAVKDNIFKVNVENQIEFPKVQEVEGEVSIKDLRAVLVGLNELIKKQSDTIKSYEKGVGELKKTLKPERIDLSSVVKAVNAIKIPEVKIPEPLKVIEISNLKELKRYFDELAKKFDIPAPVVNVPAFPQKIEISNFPKPEPEEAMTGFYWKKNELGDLTEIVEQYPSGEVISTGWVLGKVKINDNRN